MIVRERNIRKEKPMGKNREKKTWFILLLFIMVFSGCANKVEQENSIKSFSKEQVAEEKKEDNLVMLSKEVVSLDDGLYAVHFEGNDGFEEFLENGGAASDEEVVNYLTDNMISGIGDMIFQKNSFGCSVIQAKQEENGYFFGRNFDWMKCEAWIVSSKPETGYASISTVNMDFIGSVASVLPDSAKIIAALYAPLDGMNETGFCVSVNMIEDNAKIQQDTGKTALTTTTTVRLLLNQAGNVEQALDLLQQYDLHASMGMVIHFALADKEGNSVAVEYVGNKMIVTKSPVLTNFYLAEGEKQGVGTEQSHKRYDILTGLLEEKETFSIEDIRDALDSVGKHNFRDSTTTEWSVIMDQNKNRLAYYHRENYEKAYVFEIAS